MTQEGPYRVTPGPEDYDERTWGDVVCSVVYGFVIAALLLLLGWLVREALYWLDWLAR